MSSAADAAGSAAHRTFRVRLGYRGQGFHGWQFQPDVRTVEGEVRAALARLSGREVETRGASRTDTGVHAVGQVVTFALDTEMSDGSMRRALEALTPDDVRVHRVETVSPDFDPRSDAIEKRYLYRIRAASTPSLFAHEYEWWVRSELDASAMDAAARHWIGTHDFRSFQNRSEDPPETSVRTILRTRVSRIGTQIDFQVVGDGFLYRMVRNLVGTLVTIGSGRWSVEDAERVLGARDRTAAGPCAPPQGLFLMEVRYPGDPPCPIESGRVASGWIGG